MTDWTRFKTAWLIRSLLSPSGSRAGWGPGLQHRQLAGFLLVRLLVDQLTHYLADIDVAPLCLAALLRDSLKSCALLD
jgi:hypothetical protein